MNAGIALVQIVKVWAFVPVSVVGMAMRAVHQEQMFSLRCFACQVDRSRRCLRGLERACSLHKHRKAECPGERSA
jgi:hypothetical protein